MGLSVETWGSWVIAQNNTLLKDLLTVSELHVIIDNKSKTVPYFVLRFHNNGGYNLAIPRAGTRRMNRSYELE